MTSTRSPRSPPHYSGDYYIKKTNYFTKCTTVKSAITESDTTLYFSFNGHDFCIEFGGCNKKKETGLKLINLMYKSNGAFSQNTYEFHTGTTVRCVTRLLNKTGEPMAVMSNGIVYYVIVTGVNMVSLMPQDNFDTAIRMIFEARGG